VVGVSGSLPVHGIGTAYFLIKDGYGAECIWRIHNCLLCHEVEGQEQFNLLSVSQILREKGNSVEFSSEISKITVAGMKKREDMIFPLEPDDGLYSISGMPISQTDKRFHSIPCVDATLEIDPLMSGERPIATHGFMSRKSPSSLGTWTVRVLWIGKSRSLAASRQGFSEELDEFCQSYIAPLSAPKARKVYEVNNVEDMSDLSVRFFGIGTERLKQTMARSIGLLPMVKEKGKMRHVVPVHNFPQGRWKNGKTPRVSKGIIRDVHRASIGEVLFMDTFEVDDSSYGYAQAFIDYRSKYGEVIPLKSRSQVGWSFAEFCARHYIPLILIRDNIGENIGGQLMKECQKRSVKSAYICPHKKQQNYAEGYIGRITSLATYGMVYSGAPMFMWRWCIACAVFINNITATFYSEENVWATPYEVLHNEPYPDSSVVVPFGCGVLVLLTDNEQGKFKSKCALMVFIHYAIQHPLYTYAVYSPRTKRVLFRQDCIFLTNLFPMRDARSKNGMDTDGDRIIPYRSPASVREGGDDALSFQDWDIDDPLPDFQDHVTGHHLATPPASKTESSTRPPSDKSAFVHPNNPSFGPPSVVKVPTHKRRNNSVDRTNAPDGESSIGELMTGCHQDETDGIPDLPGFSHDYEDKYEAAVALQPPNDSSDLKLPLTNKTKRRPVKDRWYYEPILPINALLATSSLSCDEGDSLMMTKHVAEQPFINGDLLLDQSVGEVIPLTDVEIEEVTIDEHGARSIQGVLFYDSELDWCRINGWGVECGIPIVHYSPVGSSSPMEAEQHSSVDEIMALIKMSPVSPMTPRYEPSRVLKRSPSQRKNLCYRTNTCEAFNDEPSIGTYSVFNLAARVGSYAGKPLSNKTVRRILRAQETIFKYGTMIPRNDAEASRSPEAVRWMSGKQLEWLRLKQASTFETHWTWAMVRKSYPQYRKADIGHLFFIYDYKFSGEHRVRLVFDGSRQSEATYNETYAPTVRPESVRLFHIYAVEYSWPIQQYDVPQAFLRSEADCDIFCSPPQGFSEFPGQLLKLSKMLYGSKQAAALWYNLIHGFLLEIGFIASSMDPCFYRRPIPNVEANGSFNDAIIILHVDDMRVAAPQEILCTIHSQLFDKFQITTSDSGRFLGIDTEYDLEKGHLRMHMQTYINTTVDRFQNFDLSQGVPFREIVGSLLWIVLCIHGPELLRVKDLARRSNNFTRDDYDDALKALHRLVERKELGIVYRRGAAGKETVPANNRLGGVVAAHVPALATSYMTGDQTNICELKEHDLYKLDPTIEDLSLDIQKVLAPTNNRFTVVAYADASFAVGDQKQSISGFLVMINGTPLLWGSLKQTAVVDATCSAEYVASSICCKQIMQAENMVQFLNFTCPKPYTMYTDSQACLHIANTASKLGKVRHVEIRYHLVRCLVISGDIKLYYCITEDMIADVFTKIVAGAQDKRLSVRFYNDCDVLLHGVDFK
jgi:hypothetical protein